MKKLIESAIAGKRPRAWIAALLLVFFILASTAMQAQPPARMGISPDRYEISFDERGGEIQALTIHNLSSEPMTVKLTVSNWDLDEGNRVRTIAPSETSLDQWIVINPLQVTIPPGSPQTVRWAIMPRLRPAAKEYRALIFIEEVTPPGPPAGEGTRVRMKMRYGLPIYAQVGERIQQATLHGLEVDRDSNRVFLDIANTGNSHARMAGNFGVWRADQFPGSAAALSVLRAAAEQQSPAESVLIGQMPATVILPDNRRSIPLDVRLPHPGQYKLQFNAEFAGLHISDTVDIVQPGT